MFQFNFIILDLHTATVSRQFLQSTMAVSRYDQNQHRPKRSSIDFFETKWLEVLNVGCWDKVTVFGTVWLALRHDRRTSKMSLSMFFIVVFNTAKEIFLASRFTYMLTPNVEALDNLAVSHNFLNFHTNSTGSYIEHNASPSMIELERHPFLDRWVYYDVDIISLVQELQITTHRGHAMLPKPLAEFLACSGAFTEGVRHLLVAAAGK